MEQLAWRQDDNRDIQWSNSAGFIKRFSIVTTTTDYVVFDHVLGDRHVVHSLACAHAWAGIRAGETAVRHGKLHPSLRRSWHDEV